MRALTLVIVALLATGCGASSTGPSLVQTLPPAAVDCSLVGTLPCQTPPSVGQTPTITISGLDIPSVRLGAASAMSLRFTGSADTFAWTFGDGVVLTTTTADVTHLYGTGGFFLVTVKASKGTTSATTTGSANVIAQPAPAPAQDRYLVLRITCASFVHGAPTSCNLTTLTETGDVVAPGSTVVAWDFGDGHTASTNPLAQNTYTQPGVYLVDVSATAADGRKGTTRTTVTIS